MDNTIITRIKVFPSCRTLYGIRRPPFDSIPNNLRQADAHMKFLPMEPLIGQVHDMNLSDIDWGIVGGESGPGARPMAESCVLEIKEQCDENDVPFFFKLWGGINKKTDRTLVA